jgi:hypothetical protein
MQEMKLCKTCTTIYISAPLTWINYVVVVLSICIILCSIEEKIDLERDIKIKPPIFRFLQQAGHVMKVCGILYEHAHKTFTKEKRL